MQLDLTIRICFWGGTYVFWLPVDLKVHRARFRSSRRSESHCRILILAGPRSRSNCWWTVQTNCPSRFSTKYLPTRAPMVVMYTACSLSLVSKMIHAASPVASLSCPESSGLLKAA
ncbi:hypothetical protein OH76DRAFT_1142842 [Lentinus brumalis]|uniref:Uncharacterized protein n=1 Tax=Lentinus brumalis TaxID=2498619 RepID=A0A371DMF5_9APHY|nr:hypothetical protein OH76DRAFT_1142842 [Polyporus brumalis]